MDISLLPRSGGWISAALGLAVVSLAADVHAQGYSTDFGNSAFVSGGSVSGQDGWDTNDADGGYTYTYDGGGANDYRDIGQSEGINSLSAYRTNPNDQQALIGGQFNVAQGAVPGTSTVYLFHATNLSANSNLLFNTDYVVTAPGGDAHDGFGWTALNSGGDPLFSINFVASASNPTTLDTANYTSGGVTTPVANTLFTLNSRYKLTISVNVTATTSTFSASLVPETPKGVVAGTAAAIASNVAFTGSIADLAATWNLFDRTTHSSSGADPNDPFDGTATGTNNLAYINGGSNVMIFDNLSVVVPEPSIDVLLGLGAFGLSMMAVRRKARCA